MKKSLLAIVFGLVTIVSFAQSNEEFKPHWNINLQGGAAYTLGETKFKDLISPAAALSVGYQFNPILGIRVGASGWQAKGYWKVTEDPYKFNYLQGNVDATFNLSNLLAGYNPNRFFNAYAFLGAGVNYAFNNDDLVDVCNTPANTPEYLWKEHRYSPVGRGGLGAALRLSEHIYLTLEANANFLSDHFNSKKGGNLDDQFNGLIGLTFKLGKSKKPAPVVYEPAPVQPEPQPVVEVKKEEPKVEPVKVVEPEPVVVKEVTENIYFDLAKAVVRDSEKAKIANLASFLKENKDAKVKLVGYADKNTGNENINMNLSKKRAEAVTAALKSAGVAADRISYEYKGDTVQPFATPEENRVTVCIAK